MVVELDPPHSPFNQNYGRARVTFFRSGNASDAAGPDIPLGKLAVTTIVSRYNRNKLEYTFKSGNIFNASWAEGIPEVLCCVEKGNACWNSFCRLRFLRYSYKIKKRNRTRGFAPHLPC